MPATALVGATIIDGCGGAPVRDGTIVIAGDRITAVGPAATTEVPEGAERVDLAGKHVIPGLIDVHVHYFEWMGEMFLAHGVTAVKDVGNDVEWIATARDEVDAGLATGPRIFFTGNGLDIPPPRRDHFMGIENEDMGRRVVRLLKQHGAIGIKVREMMPVDTLRPIVDEAHQLGMKVTGHLRMMDAREAMDAGVDGLEHASGIVQATMDPRIDLELTKLEKDDIYAKYVAERRSYSLIDEARAEVLCKELATNDVAFIPTMSGWWRMPSPRRFDFAREDAQFADEPSLAYVPEEAQAIWRTSALYTITNPVHLAELTDGYGKIQQCIRQHREAGGKLLAGSDTFLSIPGINLQRELLFFVDAGLSPLEAITAATYDNAVFMGVSDEIGSIAVGRLADLVVLDADPLARIENIASVHDVYKGGRRVDRTYHGDYSVPTPRPKMVRPLWVERELLEQGYHFEHPAFGPAYDDDHKHVSGGCC
jgi:imidazolonepropionase-like amidohydrolase